MSFMSRGGKHFSKGNHMIILCLETVKDCGTKFALEELKLCSFQKKTHIFWNFSLKLLLLL